MFNPYAAIGAILLVIATFFGGVHAGKKIERAGWQTEKIELQNAHLTAMAVQAADRDKENLTNQAKARKASEDHEKKLEKVIADHNAYVADIKRSGGLRIPARKCPAPAATAEGASASGSDEAAAETERLPDEVERRLFDLAGHADQVVTQCQALQDWVRDNGFYGP